MEPTRASPSDRDRAVRGCVGRRWRPQPSPSPRWSQSPGLGTVASGAGPSARCLTCRRPAGLRRDSARPCLARAPGLPDIPATTGNRPRSRCSSTPPTGVPPCVGLLARERGVPPTRPPILPTTRRGPPGRPRAPPGGGGGGRGGGGAPPRPPPGGGSEGGGGAGGPAAGVPRPGGGGRGGPGGPPATTVGSGYFRILVTRPAPTVRLPSRMANSRPSSMAMGWSNSTVISVLSPGMTISVPSGSVTVPVTSVVRK